MYFFKVQRILASSHGFFQVTVNGQVAFNVSIYQQRALEVVVAVVVVATVLCVLVASSTELFYR